MAMGTYFALSPSLGLTDQPRRLNQHPFSLPTQRYNRASSDGRIFPDRDLFISC
jgi:hypothetical protein